MWALDLRTHSQRLCSKIRSTLHISHTLHNNCVGCELTILEIIAHLCNFQLQDWALSTIVSMQKYGKEYLPFQSEALDVKDICLWEIRRHTFGNNSRLTSMHQNILQAYACRELEYSLQACKYGKIILPCVRFQPNVCMASSCQTYVWWEYFSPTMCVDAWQHISAKRMCGKNIGMHLLLLRRMDEIILHRRMDEILACMYGWWIFHHAHRHVIII